MWPLAAAGGALELGGVLANMGAQDQVSAARGAAMATQLQKQGELNNQIFADATNSQNRYQNFGGQMDTRATDLANFYRTQGTSLPISGPTTGTIPASS